MKAYLAEFFKRFDYPERAIETLLSEYTKLTMDGKDVLLQSLTEEYGRNMRADLLKGLAQIKTHAKATGVHEYTAALLYFICLTKPLISYYREAGFSEALWENTIKDLKYKLLECWNVYGVWGTFVGEWFPQFFYLERFALGRLQFALEKCRCAYEKSGIKLTTESDVLNVRIPRSGERLTRESVLSAYQQAKEFFKEYFPNGVIPLVCCSWLLFPKNKEILDKDSNISRYAASFDVVLSGEFDDYEEAWRLFDCNVLQTRIENLPQDTSLRRAYVKWMKEGKKIGWGYGIQLYR